MILRLARRLSLWAAVLLLAGCTTLIPQTVGLRTDWPAGVPRQPRPERESRARRRPYKPDTRHMAPTAPGPAATPSQVLSL